MVTFLTRYDWNAPLFVMGGHVGAVCWGWSRTSGFSIKPVPPLIGLHPGDVARLFQLLRLSTTVITARPAGGF
jgi:hypothetical protein